MNIRLETFSCLCADEPNSSESLLLDSEAKQTQQCALTCEKGISLAVYLLPGRAVPACLQCSLLDLVSSSLSFLCPLASPLFAALTEPPGLVNVSREARQTPLCGVLLSQLSRVLCNHTTQALKIPSE